MEFDLVLVWLIWLERYRRMISFRMTEDFIWDMISIGSGTLYDVLSKGLSSASHFFCCREWGIT